MNSDYLLKLDSPIDFCNAKAVCFMWGISRILSTLSFQKRKIIKLWDHQALRLCPCSYSYVSHYTTFTAYDRFSRSLIEMISKCRTSSFPANSTNKMADDLYCETEATLAALIVRFCSDVYIHIYMHVYIHTYIHTYTHAHTHTSYRFISVSWRQQDVEQVVNTQNVQIYSVKCYKYFTKTTL
jgi:hypothetical protein